MVREQRLGGQQAALVVLQAELGAALAEAAVAASTCEDMRLRVEELQQDLAAAQARAEASIGTASGGLGWENAAARLSMRRML